MITVNLCTSGRRSGPRLSGIPWTPQSLALSGILLALSGAGVVWRGTSIGREAARMERSVTMAQEELEHSGTTRDGVEHLRTKRDRLRAELATVEAVADRQALLAGELGRLAESTPDGVWLLVVRRRAEGLVVEGEAISFRALAVFLRRLEHTEQITSPVTLVSTRSEPTASGDVVRFELRSGERPAGTLHGTGE